MHESNGKRFNWLFSIPHISRDQYCDRVTGLSDYTCDSLTNLSCPADCPKGYHGSNCTLDCSSTCKDLLCNRLGYCIACVSAYTGRYCEKVQLGLASETSGLTFSSGVGIGVAVGALVIILIDIKLSRHIKKQDREANETVQFENTSNTVYETIG
ncbi:delta-like protein A [Biomphalaria glabrata]|nr:delta-like protein A [Biomphalaria glabrata]